MLGKPVQHIIELDLINLTLGDKLFELGLHLVDCRLGKRIRVIYDLLPCQGVTKYSTLPS